MPVVPEPLRSSSFSLDSSGVAGFFGGDEAVSAMATVNLFVGRRWWGWYNSPGSYEIAKKYGQLAKSKLWDGLFPGPNVDPATLFGLDGSRGPAYSAARSGTNMAHTSHIANLIMKHCKHLSNEVVDAGRISTCHDVTIAHLHHVLKEPQYMPKKITNRPYLAAIPISASLAACIACFIFHDWYCASMIALGMVCSGISCLVIGSGRLVFSHPTPAEGSPPGDGVLVEDTQIMVVKGNEAAVNCVTRGKFHLQFTKLWDSSTRDDEYTGIGVCSVLLTGQFLAQLLLIPQGQLFGQIMFLSTLGVSWMYNLHLSSIDKELLQRQILLDDVLQEPRLQKYTVGNRTIAAVFTALVLEIEPDNVADFLSTIIPNRTRVWAKWREVVADRMKPGKELKFEQSDWAIWGDRSSDALLYRTLLTDAETAKQTYAAYVQKLDSEKAPSAVTVVGSGVENKC